MGDEIPLRIYQHSDQFDPNTPVPQPLIPEEPTASVFQVGASPWMRGAVAPYNLSEPPPSSSPTVAISDPNDPHPQQLANMNIITQEEKEQRKAKREQQLKNKELRERRIKDQEQRDLRICRKYFIVGCFGLPFLLWVNVIYFLRELKASSGNFRVRKYVWLSLIVAVIETFLWILWFVVFQLLRDSTLGALDITRSNITIGLLV